MNFSHFREPLAPGKPQMREPCGPMCRKRCTHKISEEQRKYTFEEYWKITYPERKNVIFHMISDTQTKRITMESQNKRRKRSLQYHLNDDLGQRQAVCKTMFLSTMGYHANNDRLIITVFSDASSSRLAPPQDHRGRHTPSNKIDLTQIYEHIVF